MPLYEYRCAACEHQFEVIQSFSAKPIRKCEKCGGRVEKLISRAGFVLKGGGWYKNDYTPSKPSASSSKDGASESSSKEGASESSSKEGATESSSKEGASESSKKESSSGSSSKEAASGDSAGSAGKASAGNAGKGSPSDSKKAPAKPKLA